MPRIFFKFIQFYLPFLGAGIYVKRVNRSKNDFLIGMKYRFYNKNAHGTHFGGSLYSMCDPWYMFIIGGYLGTDYVVWDKAASITFKRPGRAHVSARFHIPLEELANIKRTVDQQVTTDFEFTTQVLDDNNAVIAEIHKTIYANTKQAYKERLAQRKQCAKQSSEESIAS
ncbi:MAG: DUF4442 domain-containing protein [Pseudomonadota bacterium]